MSMIPEAKCSIYLTQTALKLPIQIILLSLIPCVIVDTTTIRNLVSTTSSQDITTPIQWICAVIVGVAGWYFGDHVARKFGFVPYGKGFQNSTKYWLIRLGVVVGGAAVGWFEVLSINFLANFGIFNFGTPPNIKKSFKLN